MECQELKVVGRKEYRGVVIVVDSRKSPLFCGFIETERFLRRLLFAQIVSNAAYRAAHEQLLQLTIDGVFEPPDNTAAHTKFFDALCERYKPEDEKTPA